MIRFPVLRVMLGCVVAFAATASWAAGRVSVEARNMPLPPLAQVKGGGEGGKTWRQYGEMRGSVEWVSKEFERVMRREGWVLNRRIELGRVKARSQLLLVSSASRHVLVMIWAIEAGRSGFAWGDDPGK